MIHGLKTLSSKNNLLNQSLNSKQTQEKSLAQMREEVVEQIKDKICGIDFDNETERMKFQEKIEGKIKSGAKLSQKEMNYLRRYNPYLYQHMLRVQQKRESLKEQLKHCRTKEEAHQAISTAFSSISDDDPVREAMVAAVANVSEQYLSSDTYKNLPNTREDLKKVQNQKRTSSDPFKQDEEDGRDDGEYAEILYSFNGNGYQEAIGGGLATESMFAVTA